MKNLIKNISIIIVLLTAFSCVSFDVESQKKKFIQKQNERLGGMRANYVLPQDKEEENRNLVRENTNVVIEKETMFVPVDSVTQKELSRGQVVAASMNDAMVTPKNFLGGTIIYDYNENKQFPIVCKVLGLTILQLEAGEIPIGDPFLSDTTRWEITGDLWRQQDGSRTTVVILKPFEHSLSTNMVIMTNKRIYQLVLSSTRDSYMPMVKFRYPSRGGVTRWVTEESITREEAGFGERKDFDEKGNFLSYNYRITTGLFFRPEWIPTEVWDDGHKTYIRLPRGVLQMEYPVVFEERNYVINYRVEQNVMILDKLIKKATLRLNGKKVTIVKLKGEPEQLELFEKKDVEILGEKPPLVNSVVFDIEGTASWMPEKVFEYDGETYILFAENVFDQENVLYMIDEKRDYVEYRQIGNTLIIPQVIKQVQLAYKNELLTIVRR